LFRERFEDAAWYGLAALFPAEGLPAPVGKLSVASEARIIDAIPPYRWPPRS
jgi:hypothetical protein